MSIRDRLQRWGENSTNETGQGLILAENAFHENVSYQEIKARIHQKMLQEISAELSQRAEQNGHWLKKLFAVQ